MFYDAVFAGKISRSCALKYETNKGNATYYCLHPVYELPREFVFGFK